MQLNILTLFPAFFEGVLNESMLKRAQDAQLHGGQPPITIKVVNIRDFATDKHHITDDRPYGGGAGMVMKIEPIHRALASLPTAAKSRTILTSARGTLFTQPKAIEYSQLDQLTIICGHYEGVDQRVADHLSDEEVRIGDYVLTGGEPAAAVILDAVTRLLPGVLGNEESTQNESHSQPGFIAPPQYTRPERYQGWDVPKVLLQGNHKEIEAWRKQQSR